MSDISDKTFKNIGIHINLFDEEDFMVFVKLFLELVFLQRERMFYINRVT